MVSEKHGLNQVPKELSSTRSEKANTHEHGMNYTRWCMVSVVFGGGEVRLVGQSREHDWAMEFAPDSE